MKKTPLTEPIMKFSDDKGAEVWLHPDGSTYTVNRRCLSEVECLEQWKKIGRSYEPPSDPAQCDAVARCPCSCCKAAHARKRLVMVGK